MMQTLAQQLAECVTVKEKLEVLSSFSPVKSYLEENGFLSAFLGKAVPEHELVIKSIIAAGQGDKLFKVFSEEKMALLLDQLSPVEKFYTSIGGIVGYQARMLELLKAKAALKTPKSIYHAPEGIDISKENGQVRKAIIDGIATLPLMAEIYPLGGAADRLRLYDEKTGVPLPAARLPFLGKSLLEGLITDLQSREYLHYKVYGAQLMTPVAVMTSEEKNNHRHILEICEEANWFGRLSESFRFFCQPMVPTINREGQWHLQGPMQLLLKPGGHGVIWRLAREEGIFDWFFACGRKKAVVRQVNNPVANADYGIVAFTGIGCAEDKRFGFASCPRQVKASEGVNVLIETASSQGYKYTLTNIEYCDFKKFGIVDQPEKPGSPYSKFPSNTNILFVDLEAILDAINRCPIPGILVNLKKLSYKTESGQKKEEEVARLESTMQNIADFFEETFETPLPSTDRQQLKTYLTYNHRRKTISAAKREFSLGSSLLETPEGCFLDILQNNRDLLVACHMQVPVVSDPLHFFEKGPSFIFLYHPALGPLYTIISQKIRGGRLHPESELQLQIAEVDIENLDLRGSLLIQAESVMGHTEGQKLIYSERVGRCVLKNVTVRNKGIDHDMPNVYWRNEIARQEVCQILLRGMSEFYAENVVLSSDHFIEVPDGERCRAIEIEGELHLVFEKIETPSWHWHMTIDAHQALILRKAILPS
ncbi:MAG TPA: UTP--glucose-1-phosphate uridylyltransferase [Rhabdochlamydiaceae bacterium]|nr:UTP--glucose-1-phosphate uridylyltransferase [Rhabdochlamydiaceae bacterium]